ncbi:DUF29 family protein [Trichormus azollae]|uniref:DUF29 family protein n=1 Tax=Trichormus azollae TaxID=1164 RepID=UPI003D333853
MGRNDLNKVRSLLRQIIIHILLLGYWHQEYARNCSYWEEEIIASRSRYNLNHEFKYDFKKANCRLINLSIYS